MRLLTIFCLLFSFGLTAKDYKSLQRLNEGDVISAEVFNDMMDRIELTLKNITEKDLMGTWDLVQTVCISGVPGNCSQGSTLTGRLDPIDGLYSQRLDTINFTDDGDGTYSFQQTNYCSLTRGGDVNAPCNKNFAIVDGRIIFPSEGNLSAAYNMKKISNSRILISEYFNGSASFNIIRLDKKNLPPEPPANLSVTNSSGTISLSWDAVDVEETVLVDGTTFVSQSEGAASSYKIQSKDAALGTYTELAAATSNSYTDTIPSGTTRWYRVYAVNEYGTSKGSNVVSISYSE
tara:strand:- start:111 stop:983 length:873 start_codon:yes stop_codon:yes gene_type:complete